MKKNILLATLVILLNAETAAKAMSIIFAENASSKKVGAYIQEGGKVGWLGIRSKILEPGKSIDFTISTKKRANSKIGIVFDYYTKKRSDETKRSKPYLFVIKHENNLFPQKYGLK